MAGLVAQMGRYERCIQNLVGKLEKKTKLGCPRLGRMILKPIFKK